MSEILVMLYYDIHWHSQLEMTVG